MRTSIVDRMMRGIRGKVPGWAFSARDFTDLGGRSAIDVALHRLNQDGEIRRVIRGLYDRPAYSNLLAGPMSPDVDQVARALARKFGWRIQPGGATAQNLLGLSTQLPARYVYRSDGPARSYRVGKTELVFKHAALKEAGFRHRESALIVEALKSLGRERMTPETIEKIRFWLPASMREKVLTDTATVTGWVYAGVQEICREDQDG